MAMVVWPRTVFVTLDLILNVFITNAQSKRLLVLDPHFGRSALLLVLLLHAYYVKELQQYHSCWPLSIVWLSGNDFGCRIFDKISKTPNSPDAESDPEP